MNALFNKQPRRFRKRKPQRSRRKIDLDDFSVQLETLLSDYKSYSFCFSLRSLVLSLPRKCMQALWNIVNRWITVHDLPHRIVVLVKDLIAFKKGTSHMALNDAYSRGRYSKKDSRYMIVQYHNKGMEMIQLPKILNSKCVRDTVPTFLSHRKPPRVIPKPFQASYLITKE